MPSQQPVILKPRPGIQRDGTQFDSPCYINGQHVRFYRGLPRKIGGYQLLGSGTEEPIRTLFSVEKTNSFDLYIGRGSGIYLVNYTTNHLSAPETQVPIIAAPDTYVPDVNNVWSFDLFTVSTDSGTGLTYIIANVRPDADQLNSENYGYTFYRDINSNDPFQQIFIDYPTNTIPLSFSGGIITVAPFLFAFGSNGVVAYSLDNDPLTWTTNKIAAISTYKIITARLARGSTRPSVLFWPTNGLILGTFIDVDTGFSYNTIDDDCTLISPTSVVKFGQIYYWIGVDQFYMYSGVVQPLPNTFSTDWFFDNVNKNALNKIFGITIKRYGEIWWFWPKGNATHCTNVLIINPKEQYWYDSELPRSAAISANNYNYPIMADSTPVTNPNTNTLTYPVWTHEIGYNRVLYNQVLSIDSFFETNIIDLFEMGGPDLQLRVRRIEPNFDQVGDMNVKVIKRGFSQGDIEVSDPYIFSPNQSKIDMNEMGRFINFQFESNTLDGFYQMGKVLLDIAPGDERPKS